MKTSRIGSRIARLSLVVIFLLITAHRLPAPIQEIAESPTPAPEQSARPTPAPERSAKPKPKPTTKPKVTSDNSQSSTKRQTPSPAPKTQPTPQSRFAGTWSGTVYCPHPWLGGDSQCTYIINASESSVTESCERFNRQTAAATVSGNSISWDNGWFKAYHNTLTLLEGGRTARVTITSSSYGNGSGTVKKVN